MKNKKVISEINRTREIMGLELLNEQLDRSQELMQYDNSGAQEREAESSGPEGGAAGPCMAIWNTVCHQGTGGFPIGTSLISPCPMVDGQWPTTALVGQAISLDNAGSDNTVVVVDSVAPNPGYPANVTPNGYFTTNATCNPTVGQDQCQCCSSGGALSMNGLVPAGTCSSYNSNTLSNCQVSPAQGTIECGGTSIDCTQYGVDYDPVTLDNSVGGFFSPQGLTLATNGNCQGIQNKIQQVNNITNQDKKDCRLDYLNLLLALCQGNSGNVQVSQTFINTMTNRYNNKGCYGVGGSATNILNNSICDKKADFCPGNTPMKQAKCQWLTNFTSTNNCNC